MDASFPNLLSSFQLLENAVVAAESLAARLPNQPMLIGRLLETASGTAGIQSLHLCLPSVGMQLNESKSKGKASVLECCSGKML